MTWIATSQPLAVDESARPAYLNAMSIELPGSIEEELRALAKQQGRDVCALVEEAVRQYLEALAITDLDSEDIAEAQAALLGELPRLPDWKASDA